LFQSLFSWNLLLMIIQLDMLSTWIQVSILVFVELALDELDQFLPIFLPSCFNPCFRGTCSWWTTLTNLYVLHLKFQSLFSWNLLLMISLASTGIKYFSFNPCFRGTCSWWGGGVLLRFLLFRVSILVFVELALDVDT